MAMIPAVAPCAYGTKTVCGAVCALEAQVFTAERLREYAPDGAGALKGRVAGGTRP